MTTTKTTITISVLAFSVLLGVRDADAGRGGSQSRIVSAIRSTNADAIIAELERAERLVCPACVEPVMALLDHDDYRVREAAAWWIARRPAHKVAVHELSVARLYGNDARLARNAADALGTFRHPRALPALGYAAARLDLSAEARAAAVQAIGTIGHPGGEPALVTALADPAPEVRVSAVKALLALRGIRSGDSLIPLLRDGDVQVRRQVTVVMGTLKSPSARAGLEQLLASDPDSLVRRNAAFALGRLGDAASRAALETAAAGDSSSLVRSVARASITSLR